MVELQTENGCPVTGQPFSVYIFDNDCANKQDRPNPNLKPDPWETFMPRTWKTTKLKNIILSLLKSEYPILDRRPLPQNACGRVALQFVNKVLKVYEVDKFKNNCVFHH